MSEPHPYVLVDYNPSSTRGASGTIEKDTSGLGKVIEVLDNHTQLVEECINRQNILIGINIVLLCIVLSVLTINMVIRGGDR